MPPSQTPFALKRSTLAVSLVVAALPAMAQTPPANTVEGGSLAEIRVLGTAEEELKQAPGVSIITAEDLEKRPPANDLAEILRTQPGVNLTGNSASGSYGNQRQIDLRGMGPENTLILVDGLPVLSRSGSQMRRSGERDTHGDTNWVPVDQIERVEIIRGPAAARYGSGASGGVVNIITKKPTDKLAGSVTGYNSSVRGGGDTRRLGFNLSGPISDSLSFRLYGNVAKTDADPVTTNVDANGEFLAAGREGTRNRDINGLLRWQLTPDQELEFNAGFSRQGNIYSGEAVTGTGYDADLIGSEVRRVYRQTAAITHKGRWGALGDSRLSFQYENTRTANCYKGSAGSGDGNCQDPGSTSALSTFPTSKLENYFLQGELHTPLKLGDLGQVLTSGFEYRQEKLDDPNAVERATLNSVANAASYRKTDAQTFALYLEDNIGIGNAFILTPGLRFDHHSEFGDNWSPSLNASYEISPEFTLKGGIARAFKAPNLYQTNPYYYWQSMGNGCPSGYTPCQIQGNPDLAPEISVNKEIGIAWNNQRGWNASVTYFRNDYKNKIATSLATSGLTRGSSYWVTQWENSGPALVHGLEGNFNVPLLGTSGDRLKLINNFTWMFSNKSKEDGQPISIIPKYTINSTLDWRATPQFSAQLTATFYGRQKPRTITARQLQASGSGLNEVGSYALVGLSGTYEFNKNSRLAFGVTNLFDKVITREANSTDSAGAATYNEPGRGFYVSYTASF